MRLRALFASMVLLLAGCATEANPVGTLEPGEEPQTQAVEWSDCDGGFECADVAAPLNWLQAGEEYVSIRLMRKAGTEQLPAMLINPGGPGASTTDWMRGGYDTIGTSWLRQNFQLVAFDPRGVGESTAVVCSDDELKDQLLYGQSEFEYGSEEDISYSEDLMLRFAESCQLDGPSPAYFNTQQTARDMELIRELLGEELLNYLGFSYGTELGATYAALFPERVGKFVLDGAVDPELDSSSQLLGQVRGFDKALRAYLADCLGATYCPFDGSVDDAMRRISGFLQARETSPLETDFEGRELGIQGAIYGILVTLYSQGSWPYLSQAFDEAFYGDGTLMLMLADFYNDRENEGGYLTNVNEANFAINCADARLKDAGDDLDQEILEASIVWGKYFSTPDISCTGWPDGIGMEILDFDVELANQPIIIGTTGDPATPYEQAVSLANHLGGKLLTLRGEGHTAYGDNGCIDSLVDAYLAGEDLGEGSLTCF